METNWTAIVPMKLESERVPGKNYRLLGDKPLFYYVISTLLETGVFEDIIIDIDDLKLKHELLKEFPRGLTILERSPELRGNYVSMNEIILGRLKDVKTEFVLQTHVTSPFLKRGTISSAIECFLNNVVKKEANDSLFSVTDSYKRYYFKEKPVNHDGRMLTTQFLHPIQEENSLFYLFSKSNFLTNQNRIGHQPIFYKTDEFEAWDIDTEFDFIIAQKLITNVSI